MKTTTLFYFVFIFCSIQAQVNWVKHGQNPVLVPSNNLYEQYIGGPSVIKDEGVFKMYYASTGLDKKGRIMMATSTDGVNWDKKAQPVLDVNPVAGSWDGFFLDCPEVIKDNTGYKMYYFAQPGDDPLQSAIGLATSTDGINWVRHPSNPVLVSGENPDDIDYYYIESPAVTYMDGKYYMSYTAVDALYLTRTALAFSDDGINWQKHSDNPIFDIYKDPDASNLYIWDGGASRMPTMLSRNEKLEVWYTGISVYNRYYLDETALHIGYAHSPDKGATWIKYNNNPVLSTTSPPFTEFETRGPVASDVIYDEDDKIYKMWYETKYGFGMAIGIDEALQSEAYLTDDLQISVYPNPVEGAFFINLNNSLTDYNIRITDIYGNILLREKNKNYIDISGYESGVYIVTIETGSKETSVKIIKK
ncbi:MAG: T9SS type A sorting domain-containing protein [Flavobacteriaceae bacterium]|jgi:predicted GH43/DUF377 family glycosyl hydrolase|nr:T9SS type A sorting domain-containing protein [Flavobacteriaceae bacterium]